MKKKKKKIVNLICHDEYPACVGSFVHAYMCLISLHCLSFGTELQPGSLSVPLLPSHHRFSDNFIHDS